MHLKRLTLRGFKSFASATTLNFEPGITCVVGPNGSGKSNVVDALAWVLGEQGAKSLRGGRMEDVIFAGTTKRPALGRAEVVLTIDNSDAALPIENPEVSISRTMFRNGGSDYAINGEPVRLLDVQELLSDAGIGREMHVIVGQGRLDSILSATPESRRGFIEEAAGVLKHRKRKEKALRKLESTKGNLDRLSDLIKEIRRTLKPLGRQADVAKRAATIQAEVRDATARLLADDLVDATSKFDAELVNEQANIRQRALAKAEFEQAEAAQSRAVALARASARAFEAAQQRWYACGSLEQRIASLASIAAERMRHARRQPVFDERQDPNRLEAAASEVRELEAALDAEIEQSAQALAEATERKNAIEAQHKDAETAFLRATQAVADRREGIARTQGQLASVQARIDASSDEIGRLTVRKDEALERERRARVEFHRQESQLAGLEQSERDLDQRFEGAAGRAERLRTKQREMRASLSAAHESKISLSARVEVLKTSLERSDASADVAQGGRGALGFVHDFFEVDEGFEAAVAAALGTMAEAAVVDSLDSAASIVTKLKDDDGGRASMVIAGDGASPVTNVAGTLSDHVRFDPRIEGVLAPWLGRFLVARDVTSARKLVAANPDADVVTLDGDVFSPRAAAGGSSAKPSLIATAKALESAQGDLDLATADVERLTFALAGIAAQVEQAELDEAEALRLLHEFDATLEAVSAALSNQRIAAATAQNDHARAQEAIELAQLKRQGDEASLKAIEERLDDMASSEAEEAPDSINLDELAALARAERECEVEARLTLRSQQERKKAMRGRVDALMRTAAKERHVRRVAQEAAQRAQQESEIANSVAEGARQLSRHVKSLSQRITAERDHAERARTEAERDVEVCAAATKVASEAVEALLRGEHSTEVARVELRLRIEQLSEKSLVELGLERDVLIAEYGPDREIEIIDGERAHTVPYVREQQQIRLAAARRDLAVLGKVNPLALEEFDALNARHAFLVEQLDDLNSSRKDLLAIVDEVDTLVERVFREAFTDVSATFEDVFARLFPGGRGRLVLTDPTDWGNTGVEIEATPAGKQVKRLSLLSGGERSLVGVAFLVSLFIARPSPFYILDEVEAALDDTNLGRLLGIYRELRARSQLLIITHQKRTMEVADALYGVSMRGDGISAVISQKLAEDA